MSTQLHNPDNLTEWGQSEGWRLLTVEEMSHSLPKDAEYLDGEDAAWCASSYRGEVARIVDQKHTTYRTREPLPSQPDDLTYYEHELPKIIAGVRRGEKWESFLNESWYGPGNQSLDYLLFNVSQNRRVRLAPVPVVKTWDCPADVPGPVCWLREKGTNKPSLIVYIETHGVVMVDPRNMALSNATTSLTWGVVKDLEHSTDRIHWSDCVKPEGGK